MIGSFISGGVWESACPPTESLADSWLEGTGTCHPVALNTAHTLPLQGSLKVAGLFYPALGSIQSRGRISLTFMYDKRPKLLALLNQA